MVIALSIASWFTAARIVRGQIITLKENDYVRAAHAVGARWYRILGRHLLPNTLGVLDHRRLPRAPGRDPGRGVPLVHRPRHQPAGRLAGARWRRTGRDVYRVAPDDHRRSRAVAIATLVLCANFIADGLRDALDPRTRET